MRILTLIVFGVIMLSSCGSDENNGEQQSVLASMEDDYLQRINELGITDLYNEVKWRLYCNHCDVPVKNCMGRELQGVTYGMLDLKVFYLKFENGVGEMAYTFIYNDSLQCAVADMAGNKVHGIGFEQNGKKPLYYISAGETNKISLQCDTMVDISKCPTRMLNPKQPVVLKYLNKNRSMLNPWFHMEAMKRGYLN